MVLRNNEGGVLGGGRAEGGSGVWRVGDVTVSQAVANNAINAAQEQKLSTFGTPNHQQPASGYKCRSILLLSVCPEHANGGRLSVCVQGSTQRTCTRTQWAWPWVTSTTTDSQRPVSAATVGLGCGPLPTLTVAANRHWLRDAGVVGA